MIYDQYRQPIYQESDLIKLFQTTNNINVLDNKDVVLENTDEMINFKNLSGLSCNIYQEQSISIEDFDKQYQSQWFIPEEYNSVDIENYLIDICPTENYQRLAEELAEFRNRNLIPLLKLLKYLVDIFEKNNVVLGVGRGSSVASYVLYLLNVHLIDSVKYDLDWRDFFKE